MKFTTLAFGAISISQLAAAQPHRADHAHREKHNKRNVVETIIDTVYAEVTGPNVIILVNQNGVPISTMTEGLVDENVRIYSTDQGVRPHTPMVQPTSATTLATVASSQAQIPTPAATEAPAAAPVVVEATSTAAAPVSTTSVSAPVLAASLEIQIEDAATKPSTTIVAVATKASTSSVASASTVSSSGNGFSYSPYTASGECKTQDQVNTDFEDISGFSFVRIYGVDCDQTNTVLTAAKAKGMKLFAGVFDITELSSAISTIADAADGDWSYFHTVSIGNELVDGGTAVDTVVAAVNSGRTLLRAAGFTGPVVIVDTLVAARTNPSICDNSDYCAVNCHPFFDGGVTAQEAGSFLTAQILTLQAVLSDESQEIMITETGWPSQGTTNELAVPSTENQADAISSIKSEFSDNPGDVVLFTVYNDMWKTNTDAQFEAEQFWGFNGTAPSG
ncbi:glycoside hydrolase superfamily [Calycina marina]|uniref:Glycoside hydrolase superfamily n=1 Tax=Calycina marina TaxID=1763456 RepID=A0A9P7Z1C2_9HELO|nr:glycoside hydrolase superfamily [Calycina marina]